jgi:hypothetical protein
MPMPATLRPDVIFASLYPTLYKIVPLPLYSPTLPFLHQPR